jgi:hypothetical protein
MDLFCFCSLTGSNRHEGNCHISTASDALQWYHKKSNGPSSFLGMVTGTGQPGGFPGRVSAGMGTGYNFSGPETRGHTTGLQIFDFLMEFKSFQGATNLLSF